MKTEKSKPTESPDKAQKPKAKIEGVQELTDNDLDRAGGAGIGIALRKSGGTPTTGENY